jgi:hypothetical protein
MRAAVAAMVLAAGALAVLGCGGADDPGGSGRENPSGGRPQAIKISASDLPRGTWPLTVSSGELRCEGAAEVIFSGPGLRDYGVSVAAVKRGLPPLEGLWKREPGRPRVPMDITPLLARGLALCDTPTGTIAAAKRRAKRLLKRRQP